MYFSIFIDPRIKHTRINSRTSAALLRPKDAIFFRISGLKSRSRRRFAHDATCASGALASEGRPFSTPGTRPFSDRVRTTPVHLPGAFNPRIGMRNIGWRFETRTNSHCPPSVSLWKSVIPCISAVRSSGMSEDSKFFREITTSADCPPLRRGDSIGSRGASFFSMGE